MAQTNHNSSLFDSLSNIFSIEYNNSSGKYLDFSVSRIPEHVLEVIKEMVPGELCVPVETDGGYFLVYYYDHQEEFVPNLDNSWNLIYQYAKQEKQNFVFEGLVKDIKTNIYINIF